MTIVLATDIRWNPQPHCPICGVGITASGESQPFAVDDSGEVYCRRHGECVEPRYPVVLAAYLEAARRRVREYLDAGPGGPPTEDELRGVDAELSQ